MSVATVTDVATAIGRPISESAEQGQVQWWLDAVELQIVARLGAVADLDPTAVRYVEVEAVAARLTNPEGYQSETIDDYTYRLPVESRRVTILEEWWRLLDPNTSADAYSVRPGFEPDTVDPLAGWA